MRNLGSFLISSILTIGNDSVKDSMSLRLYKARKSQFHALNKDTHVDVTNKHFSFPIHFLDNTVLNMWKCSTPNY